MNNLLLHMRQIQLVALLVLFCQLFAMPVVADDCITLPTQTVGELATFDEKIRLLNNADELNQNIKDELCARGRIHTFLTDGSDSQYSHCFISAGEADNFWNAGYQKSLSLISKFRSQCIHWAEKRYQPWIARLEKQERIKLPARKGPLLAQPGKEKRLLKNAMQQAMAEGRALHLDGNLQWFGESKSTGQANTELAAYLFSTELQKANEATEASAAHLQQHFTEMMGAPQVISVTSTGKEDEYRARIQSGHHKYTLDVLIESETPLTKDITPWILFSQQAGKVVPVTAVLQTSRQVITARQLESHELPLTALPEKNVTRLPANSEVLQIQLRCIPHDGGQARSLRYCLKPDGEISILTADSNEQFFYQDFSRKQRNYQSTIQPPFVLLVRTGSTNRRGEIRLKIIDTTREEAPTLFDKRAIARHDSLLVYSE